MKNIYGFSFLLFLTHLVVHGQINPEWVTTYNGFGPSLSLDKSYAIAVDLLGNIYVTGESYGTTNNPDYLTVKIAPAGDTLWTRRYNGPDDGSDVATDIAVDNFGDIYVTGRSFGAATDWDYLTLKYNSSGDLLWLARHNAIPGNSSQDVARSICTDNLGNCYVSGVSTFPAMDDILTIKYNSSGVEEWINRYDGPLGVADQAYTVKVDGLGNVYVVGFVDANSTSGTRDYCTIKYNSSGAMEWLARYDGPDSKVDEGRLIDFDGLGNVYVTGVSESATTYFDYLTINYNSAGVEQWTARYTYSSLLKEDSPRDMVVDAAGSCYITGMSRSDQNWAGFSTVKYDPSGVLLWTNRYDPFHTEDPYGIALDNLGNVYVSGESNGDAFTIAYTSLGSEIWNSRFTNPGLSQEFVSDIVVDTSSTGSPKVYVSGSSQNQAQNSDYQILKYSTITSVDNQDVIPISFSLSQNYPNPFNPSTKISWQSPVGSHQTLKVYDVLGNEVATLVDEFREQGRYEVEFNAEELSSGVYFYRLQAGSFVETKKMILLR